MAYIDPVSVFDVFIRPSGKGIKTALDFFRSRPSPNGPVMREEAIASEVINDLMESVSQDYKEYLSKKVNFVQFLGSEWAADAALHTTSNIFVKMMLQQIAHQWSPIKLAIDFGTVINRIRDPNAENFIAALREAKKSRKVTLPTCVVVAFMMKLHGTKLQMDAGLQGELVELYEDIFSNEKSNLLVANALFGMVDFNINAFQGMMSILDRYTTIVSMVNLECCSDEQLCEVVNMMSHRENFVAQSREVMRLDSFVRFLDERPIVKKHFEETSVIADVIQS